MAEFIVTKARPVWITWWFKVEANTEAQAIEMAKAGELMEDAYEIGENLDSYDAIFDATPAKPEKPIPVELTEDEIRLVPSGVSEAQTEQHNAHEVLQSGGFDYYSKVKPSVFIQWKGTIVCMDFYCRCGAHGHFDGDFAIAVQCPHCSTVWEMPIFVYPREADERTLQYYRENPKMLSRDEDK